jgi:hypothetical protein
MLRKLLGVVGVLAVLLGGLWLLQGLGIVHMKPVACVADCRTLDGPSMQWAVIGAVVVAVGLFGAVWGFRRR